MQTAAHPKLREKLAGLAAMRDRSHLATEDFYTKIGRPAPSPPPRFYATIKGNMWRIIDSFTGKTCAFRSNYANALRVLDGLEAAARCKLVRQD
nr:hypothetical protein [uncultured Pseudomonas sp.]